MRCPEFWWTAAALVAMLVCLLFSYGAAISCAHVTLDDFSVSHCVDSPSLVASSVGRLGLTLGACALVAVEWMRPRKFFPCPSTRRLLATATAVFLAGTAHAPVHQMQRWHFGFALLFFVSMGCYMVGLTCVLGSSPMLTGVVVLQACALSGVLFGWVRAQSGGRHTLFSAAELTSMAIFGVFLLLLGMGPRTFGDEPAEGICPRWQQL